MRADRCDLGNNYHTKMDEINIFIDVTNKRVKIIDFNNISIQNIKRIIHFASKLLLGKVICTCDSDSIETFLNADFVLEGKIDGYFKGKDAFAMSYFISSDRKVCTNSPQKDLLVKECLAEKNTYTPHKSNSICEIRTATENDIQEMIKLFSTVFLTYPSPIYNKKYLKKTMNDKILYKVAVSAGSIVAIASADMDKENLSAEITDCATSPDYRGRGILSDIIYSLESELKDMGFITLYSLSRAINPSINYVLSKHNYHFTGRMINNCNICGTFEDMNIWVKNIVD